MVRLYKRLALLLLIVGAISGAVIYFTIDINTLKHLNAFRPWSIGAALLLLIIGLYFDGTRLMHLVHISGEQISFTQAVQVVFGNYFLALLTPGAAGGAVAQVMFLRRAGVPTGKATVLVLVRTILSILFLLLCLPVIFYIDPGLMPWIPENVLVTVSVTIIVATIGGIWLLRTEVPYKFLLIITKRLQQHQRRRIFELYRDVRKAVLLLSAAPIRVLQVFCESALSLIALYAVVPILFLGIGAVVDWPMVMGRMIFLNFLIYFAPTPGGSGIAEGGFVLFFNDFLPPGTVGILAVAWRMLAEYLPFMIGLYFTVKVFGRDFLTAQFK